MPFKDKTKDRKYHKELMRKKREGVTKEGVTGEGEPQNVTPEMFEGKPRSLKLSDGQVLDRANQPKPNKHLPRMEACNRANDYRNTMSQKEKLARLLISLDKTMTGLDGKPLRLSTLVRYGIGGFTFDEIKELL